VALSTQIKTGYNVNADYLSIDLSKTGAALQLSDWVKNLNAPVSVLINNAGMVYGVILMSLI
jgi:short-subunit dehydrogenase